ncbi:MAG: 16S rRNA (guanine(527)-N(7))-methyltransferase RsmG [bacterium]
MAKNRAKRTTKGTERHKAGLRPDSGKLQHREKLSGREKLPAREKLTPGLPSLKEWFQRSNLSLTDRQYKQLWQYHNLLRKKNKEYDLTRIVQFDTMVLKHYIDSILVARLLDWNLPSPLLDLGTGAGLPAIPLKIACPETEFILSEGRHKRIQFLHEVVEALDLQKIEIYGHKTSASFSRPIRGVITRAVEPMAETLAKVKKSLQPGGWAIFMKGPQCDGEIAEATESMGRFYRLDRDVAYTIPHTPHQRRLVIFERLSDPMEAEPGKHRIPLIESPANETFKQIKALLTSRGIKKEGHALVFGQKIIAEIMRDFPGLCTGLILSPSEEKAGEQGLPEDILRELHLDPGQVSLYRLSRPLYRELDIFGTGADILVVRTPSLQTWQADETTPGCTLMIPFQDPENTGAVIRSAAAFGVREIILLQEAANPYHPKSIRAGGSAVFRVSYRKGPSIQEIQPLIQAARRKEVHLITLSMEGADISRFEFPDSFILLPGLEGPGLPQDLRSQALATPLAIPMEPGLESLNAATSAAIALYEWRRKRRKE